MGGNLIALGWGGGSLAAIGGGKGCGSPSTSLVWTGGGPTGGALDLSSSPSIVLEIYYGLLNHC